VSEKTRQDRDELDGAIARYVRAARHPVDLPSPGPGEPSDDELLRVVEGGATPEERARVDEAARRSAWTRDRLELLREALAETGHVTPMERAARYVFAVARSALEFLRGATEPVAQPAVAVALRKGASEAQPDTGISQPYFELLHDFDDPDQPARTRALQATIHIEHSGRAGAPIDLQIRLQERDQTRALSRAISGPATNARVSLLRGSATVESTPVDERGAVTFTGLEAARYRLEVRRNGRVTGSIILDFVSE
jgi:ribosomal protein S28E/S33